MRRKLHAGLRAIRSTPRGGTQTAWSDDGAPIHYPLRGRSLRLIVRYPYNRDPRMKLPPLAALALAPLSAQNNAQNNQPEPAPIRLEVTRVSLMFTVQDKKGRF